MGDIGFMEGDGGSVPISGWERDGEACRVHPDPMMLRVPMCYVVVENDTGVEESARRGWFFSACFCPCFRIPFFS